MDLVRARVDRLFAIARRILRDVDRAEDALQDALVIAWRDLPSLRDPDRFDYWLQRVLTIDVPRSPDDMLSIADRDQLDRAFRRLTPEERAILVLRHYIGYEPSEIADVLG